MAIHYPMSSTKPKSKYGNVRVGAHASKKEHHRAAVLRLWQRAGAISNLREQVPYVLIPTQFDNDDSHSHHCVERSVRYVADFVYTDNSTGQTVVEDAKGVRTKEYIIKRKLMLYIHGIRIKEI